MMRKVNIECDALSSPIAASPININARKALVIMANLIKKKKKQRGIKDKGVFVSGKWDLNTIHVIATSIYKIVQLESAHSHLTPTIRGQFICGPSRYTRQISGL